MKIIDVDAGSAKFFSHDRYVWLWVYKFEINPFDANRSRRHLDVHVIAESLDLWMPSRLKYLALYKSELVVIYLLKL